MKNNFFSGTIISQWKQIISKHGLSWNDSFIKWDLPSSVDADFAIVAALQLARKLEKTPYQLAFELSKNLSSECSFEVIVTKEGYLNCYIKEHFYKSYLKAVNNKHLISSYKNDFFRVNIEFISANPTGYLHLGHLRNAFIGDMLAKVYDFAGYQVTREYYINDRGNQIDQLINSVLFYYKQLNDNKLDFSEEDLHYKGPAIKDAATWLLKNSISPNYDNNGKESIYFREKIVDFFLEKIRTDLLLYGVQFDNWFSEKKMLSNYKKVDSLINDFKKKNLVYYKDGALFLRTEIGNDEKDRVLIKTNGELTYFLSDILYHLNKIERADSLINIWGSDHHGYVERLRSALQMLGNNEQKLVVILVQMVTLLENKKNKKFSKRAGTIIEIKEALAIVGRDQLKFCLLEKEVGHTVSINLSILKEQEEKSRLYYLQYAHARCHQLLLKAKSFNLYNVDWSTEMENSFLLTTKEEKNILKSLICFESIIYTVIKKKNPSIIIQYLQLLAKEFQTWYQSYQIVNNLDQQLTKQRISLVRAVKEVLNKGLFLCGVNAPNLMKN